jgi:hypothetical protein
MRTFLPKILQKIILSQNHVNPVGLVIKYTRTANLSQKFKKNLPGTNGLKIGREGGGAVAALPELTLLAHRVRKSG